MDEVIDVNDQEAQGVAIIRQRKRVPFEIINSFLTVICLASTGLVVFGLLQIESLGDVKEQLPVAIHAEAKSNSKDIIYMEAKNKKWVRNGTIHVPCDGLYLVYAQVTTKQNSAITIKCRGADPSEFGLIIGHVIVNQTLLTSTTLRNGLTIGMEINDSTLKEFKGEAVLGIVLLEADPDMKTCWDNMRNNPQKLE